MKPCSTCRFTQEDAIKDGGNWYAYCGDDPLNYVDENGQVFFLATAAIGAAIGGLVGGVTAGVREYKDAKASGLSGKDLAKQVAVSAGKSALAGAAVGGAIGLGAGAIATAVTGVATSATAIATATTAETMVKSAAIGATINASATAAKTNAAEGKINVKQTAVSFVSGTASGVLGGSSLGAAQVAMGNAAISATSSVASDLVRRADGETVSNAEIGANAFVSGATGWIFGRISGDGITSTKGEYIHYTPNQHEEYQLLSPSYGMIKKNLQLSTLPQATQAALQPFATEEVTEYLSASDANERHFQELHCEENNK